MLGKDDTRDPHWAPGVCVEIRVCNVPVRIKHDGVQCIFGSA